MELYQHTRLRIEPKEIRNAYLSVPRWKEMADTASPANRGFVRHGCDKAVDHLPKAFKISYAEHVQEYLRSQGDPEGKNKRALIIFGARNGFQNLLLPLFHAKREPSVLHRPDEPLQSATYHAVCAFVPKQANHTNVQFRMERLRFTAGSGWRTVDLDQTSEEEVMQWAVTGQPILWDGEVPPLALLAANTYDLRHIWHLLWEEWQINQWPECRDHKRIHDELMSSFVAKLESPITERASDLARIAAREGLAVETGFLHSSIGVSANGSINLLLMTGSVQDIGRAHKTLGSERAILLDNGGSCGLGIWTMRSWQSGNWLNAETEDLPQPTFIGNNTYFRPRAHATVVMELNSDLMEAPFLPGPMGNAPWSPVPRTQQ